MNYQDFSSVLKRKPDADQEKVIRSLQNTIVSAGAGSGKTQTLASRFVYLITADLEDSKGGKIENPTVDRILTLTFTKKAAAEMYQRIYMTLKKFVEKSSDAAAKEKAQRAIDNFSKARIQTLDSYSASILRQAAPLYGIRPDFTSGADSSQTKDLAFNFVMENRNNPAIQWISAPAKIEDCAKLFSEAASQNASIADSINKEKKCSVFYKSLCAQKEAAKDKWNKDKPLALLESKINDIQDLIPENKKSEAIEKILSALDFWNAERTKAALDYVKQFSPKENFYSDIQKLFDFANSDECAIVKIAVENFRFTNKIPDESLKNIINNDLFGENGQSAGIANEFLGLLNFFSDLKYLEELHPLLDKLTDQVNDFKRKSGALTFKDTNDLALLALREQESIRKQERDAYDFIMIDEFQDNNAANRDLLLYISKDDNGKLMENRLFFVGDEKQSIYKFRGADVSVFNSLEDFIKPCAKLPMRRNYRSSNILLDEFNQIFGGFLPDDKEQASLNDSAAKIFNERTQFNFEAKFDQSARAAFPESKEKEKKTGARTQLCLYASSKLDQDVYLEEKDSKAFYITKKILSLHQTQNIAFKDIALLVKSRTNYTNIARIFSLNKIPFALDQQAKIFRHATANDFYNALRLCVYPSDINAFASFLNSPFAGLTLNGTEKVLSLFPRKAFDPEIKVQGLLTSGELERYQAAEIFYKDMTDFALSNPISDSIYRLWQKEGYKFSPNANEEHYDLLYELARKADLDAKDLSWFVDQLAIERGDSFKEESEIDIKETDYPVESSDAVNIMTIHKSKGLQFKYVFVWGLAESKGGNPNNNSKIFQSEKFGAVVANGNKKQNLFALLAKVDDKKKDDAETRRLIYVALTRAIDGLFIIGNPPPKKSDAQPKAIQSVIKFYLENDQIEAPFEIEEIPPCQRGSERPISDEKTVSLEEMKKIYGEAKLVQGQDAQNIWTSPSALEEAADPLADQLSQSSSLAYPEINSFVNASALAKNDYGTLFHAFMESWSHDYKNWSPQNVSADEYFKWEPKTQKLSLDNKKILLGAFFKILDKFLANQDNRAFDALKNGRAFKAEYKFKTKINSFIVKGTMDAVFQNPDGTWTVLDYKTDLAENPQIYYNQLACYKKTAADLFADGDQKKVRCVLFYAENGHFVDITDEAQKTLEGLTDEKIRNLIEKA